LRSRAIWARSVATQSEDIKSRIDLINAEVLVLQTAAKIALVNLGNVSRSLQKAFGDTETLADKKLAQRRLVVDNIMGGLQILSAIKIHPVFGKEEETLGDYFVMEDVAEARDFCSKTNEDVSRRFKGLKRTMEEFIDQSEGLKKEVLKWEPEQVKESGQIHEIGLIADKIERGIISKRCC
jgi:Autophagy protein ATG17-like domain